MKICLPEGRAQRAPLGNFINTVTESCVLTDGDNAMTNRVLSGQSGVDARALARFSGCIDAEVIIIADLRNKLRLEYC